MNIKLLFRKDNFCEEELKIASKYFTIVENRNKCKDTFVLPRYSALPFFKELVEDLKDNNCKLIDELSGFNYISNFDYYEDVKDLTFKTWDSNNFYECLDKGPFVVKGRTNGKKSHWKTHMYCEDREALGEVMKNFYSDTFLSSQGILIRKYEKLKSFGKCVSGLSIANEWRFFFLGNEIIAYGYYWSQIADLSPVYINEKGIELAKECAKRLSPNVNFFVVDVAEKENGEWIMVEANHGYMSGLSEINPDVFYSNLKTMVEKYV